MYCPETISGIKGINKVVRYLNGQISDYAHVEPSYVVFYNYCTKHIFVEPAGSDQHEEYCNDDDLEIIAEITSRKIFEMRYLNLNFSRHNVSMWVLDHYVKTRLDYLGYSQSVRHPRDVFEFLDEERDIYEKSMRMIELGSDAVTLESFVSKIFGAADPGSFLDAIDAGVPIYDLIA